MLPNARLAAGFAFVFAAYHLLLGRFFPNAHDAIGRDYSGGMTYLLAGYNWWHKNGFFAVPWFTPAFCGGLPMFGDPLDIYYSVEQLLTIVFDPLTSIYLTILLFAALGFWGSWTLLTRVFSVERPAAFFGSTLFLFNGFFACRMIVGHIGFHGFMLLPWLLFVVLKPVTRGWRLVGDCALAGLIVAYWIYAGLGSMIVPVSLGGAAVVLLFLWRGGSVRPFALRLFPTAAIAFGLTVAKLVATGAFLSHFDRSLYPLPGASTVRGAAKLIFRGLFLSTNAIGPDAQREFVNMKWAFERHELEYGVTLVPLFVLVAALVLRVRRGGAPTDLRWRRVACIAGLLLLFAIPIALNVFDPRWNAFLKSLPLLRSSSSLVRWSVLYIPPIVFGAALALESLSQSPRVRETIALMAIALVVVQNFATDRNEYDEQSYRPETVVAGYRDVASGKVEPRIAGIEAFLDPQGNVMLLTERNDTLAHGKSQLLCYNAIFGYSLEHFPLGTLHPGDALEDASGVLNVKNPACYLFPEENRCVAGDHFQLAQKKSAEAFLDYRPFPFEISSRQIVANRMTQLTLFLLAALGLGTVFVWLRCRFIRATSAPRPPASRAKRR